MSQPPSNSLLFAEGAAQIKDLMDAFFQACVKKAQAIDPRIQHYHPVLSDLREYPTLLAIDSPLLHGGPGRPNDFCAEKLQVLADFLQEASARIDDGGVRMDNQRVHTRMRESAASLQLFQQAFGLIEYWDPWMRDLWSHVIQVVVPLCRTEDGREDGSSFSNRNFLGGFFASPEHRRPDSLIFLNVTFAHELGHQALYIYQFAGPLIEDTQRLVYSGVRKVKRPAPNALHAAVALAYMLSAIRALKKAPWNESQHAYLDQLHADYGEGLQLGLKALQDVPLTDLGAVIAADLAEALR